MSAAMLHRHLSSRPSLPRNTSTPALRSRTTIRLLKTQVGRSAYQGTCARNSKGRTSAGAVRVVSEESEYDALASVAEHASLEITTKDSWERDSGIDLPQDEDEEYWETSGLAWFFRLTELVSDSGDHTYQQAQLQQLGMNPDDFQLGQRLALWVGKEDFFTTSKFVHLRDQFRYLSRDPETLQPLEALPPGLNVEALDQDILQLCFNTKFETFYPIKLYGSGEGTDMLPCLFQLPDEVELSPAVMYNLLGISESLVSEFPKPRIFKTADAFLRYVEEKVEHSQENWSKWLADMYDSGELDEDTFHDLQDGPQFEDYAQKVAAFASYAEPPFIAMAAGNGHLNSDPMPVFFLATSPVESNRVIGAMFGVVLDGKEQLDTL